MWGAVIGAGLSLAGSIFGGSAAAKAHRQAQNRLNQRKAENQARYDRLYNEDPTQRADAQALLTRVEDSIRKRNRAAAGRAAVMGGSSAEVAAAKEANNEALTQVVSDIHARNEARKDQIEAQYEAKKDQLETEQAALDGQKAQARSQGVQGVLGAAGNIVSSLF